MSEGVFYNGGMKTKSERPGPPNASFSPMAGTGPDMRTLLPQQEWEFLFHQLVLFASYQIHRLRWRGATGGLLPDGYDANSLAAQAIFEFLETHNSPADPVNNQLSLKIVLWELKRTVLRHVTRLHHRKENFILCHTEDLAPVLLDDGEGFNPTELIPDRASHPDAVLLEKESLARFDETKSCFSLFISREPKLGSLFELLPEGVENPHELASSLELRPEAVRNLRRRLRRRWRDCFPGHKNISLSRNNLR